MSTCVSADHRYLIKSRLPVDFILLIKLADMLVHFIFITNLILILREMNLVLERPFSVVERCACLFSLPMVVLFLIECMEGHVSHGLSHVRVVHHPRRASCRPPLPHLSSTVLTRYRLLFLFFYLFLDNDLRSQSRLLPRLFPA